MINVCEFCGEIKIAGYIDDHAACKKCIDKHIDNDELHPLTKKYLKYVNGDM